MKAVDLIEVNLSELTIANKAKVTMRGNPIGYLECDAWADNERYYPLDNSMFRLSSKSLKFNKAKAEVAIRCLHKRFSVIPVEPIRGRIYNTKKGSIDIRARCEFTYMFDESIPPATLFKYFDIGLVKLDALPTLKMLELNSVLLRDHNDNHVYYAIERSEDVEVWFYNILTREKMIATDSNSLAAVVLSVRECEVVDYLHSHCGGL